MPRTMLRIGALPPLQVSPATLVTVLLVAVLMFPSLQGPGLSAGRSALVAPVSYTHLRAHETLS